MADIYKRDQPDPTPSYWNGQGQVPNAEDEKFNPGQQWAPPGNYWDPTNQGSTDPLTVLQRSMGVPFYAKDATQQQLYESQGYTPVGGPGQEAGAIAAGAQPWGLGGVLSGLQTRQAAQGATQQQQGGALQQLAQLLEQRKQAGLVPTDQPTGLLAGGLAGNANAVR